MTDDQRVIGPQPGPQTIISRSAADIALFGGSIGCGKSYWLLLEPLRHIHNPEFRAVIVRKTSTELTDEGGMVDESRALYEPLGGSLNQQALRWTFPSGARIRFRHIGHDYVGQWKGSQIAMLGIDQVEDIDEHTFFYLMSRMRSVSGVRPYVRLTANPKPGWLQRMVSWWIQPDGYPDYSKSGVLRWFVRDREGNYHWCADDKDSRFDLAVKFPNLQARSFTFVPATLDDNKILNEINPEYAAAVDSLDVVNYERLRMGNWKIADTIESEWGVEFFPDCDFFDEWPDGMQYVIQQLDPSYGKKDGDFQACILAGTKGDGLVYVSAAMVRMGLGPLARKVVSQASEAPVFPIATVVEEFTYKNDLHGSVGQEIMREAKRAKARLNVKTVNPNFHMIEGRTSRKDLKMTRVRASLDSLVRNRRFRWHNTPGTLTMLDQMKEFPSGKNDDGPDALARAVDTLNQLGEELYG